MVIVEAYYGMAELPCEDAVYGAVTFFLETIRELC